MTYVYDAPVEFLLYEVYSSEEAFRQHQQTELFKTLGLMWPGQLASATTRHKREQRNHACRGHVSEHYSIVLSEM